MNKAVAFVTFFNDVAATVSPWSLRCRSVRLFSVHCTFYFSLHSYESLLHCYAHCLYTTRCYL